MPDQIYSSDNSATYKLPFPGAGGPQLNSMRGSVNTDGAHVGARDIASGRTQQKTPFLPTSILHSHAAAGADRTDIPASDSCIVASITVATLTYCFMFHCCVTVYCAVTL
jgi:hypothetical protein